MSASEPKDIADQFLLLACLNYDGVGPSQWAEARALLAEQPQITEGNVHAAAAAGDLEALRSILDADPGAANRQGGPHRWAPLVYLAYARHDPDIARSAVLDSARLILDAGADPNAGFLWHGMTPPFSVLTGVFGEGEGGPVRQPRHPHSLPLARLLLEAGADPNDAQALYNRMFEDDDDHLVLLFEFGLGTETKDRRQRLGDDLAPAELLRDQLSWAIIHGMTDRVRLLVSSGVDPAATFDGGTTAATLAATSGHRDLVEYLVGHGSPPPTLTPASALVAAILAGDRAEVEQLRIDNPGLVEILRTERPALTAWAAATGRSRAVEILSEVGFDINAKGRTDVPSEEPWQTGLHKAVEDSNLALARTFLRLGADPDVLDERFGGTPLDWAHHFEHHDLIELLEPLTTRPARSTDSGSDN